MNTVSIHQLNRLILRLEKMLTELNTAPSIALCRGINDSFHMQKVEELKLLHTQLHEAMRTLENIQARAFEHYKTAYCRWKKDVRWLNRYRREKEESGTASVNRVQKYKGALSKQSLSEADRQLRELRNGWK